MDQVTIVCPIDKFLPIFLRVRLHARFSSAFSRCVFGSLFFFTGSPGNHNEIFSVVGGSWKSTKTHCELAREISRVNEPFGFAQLISNFSVDFEWRCLAEDLVLARKPYRKGRLSTIDLLNKITCSAKQRIFFNI